MITPMQTRRFSVFTSLAVLSTALMVSSPLVLAEPKETPSFTVSVTGQGQVSAVPDMVVINASLRLQGPKSQDLLNSSNKTMAAVITSLKNAGVNAKSIQAGQLQLTQRWNNENGRSQPDGYEAVRPLQVSIDDSNRYPHIIDLLAQQGVNNFDGITFDFSNRAELADKALVLASKDASRQARLLGESMGSKLCRPQQVSLAGIGGPQPMMEMAVFKSRGTSADAFQPGEQSVTASVSATFICDM